MRVLDDQHRRPRPGQLLKEREHLDEQPGPRLLGGARRDRACRDRACRDRLAKLGQQPDQLTVRGTDHACEVPVTHQIPENHTERRERQADPANVGAPAGQHPRRRSGGRTELADQP